VAAVIEFDGIGPGPVEVLAAGGVVVRPGAGGEEVLVVRRPPPRDDWTLPKGKLEPGESVEAAACREVEEETGVVAHVGSPVAVVRYCDGRGRRKQVVYFAMTVAGQGRPTAPPGEIVEARWVAVDAALDLLTYDADRAVVEVALGRAAG
jgi:8-oxo-dGTP diphosphatase